MKNTEIQKHKNTEIQKYRNKRKKEYPEHRHYYWFKAKRFKKIRQHKSLALFGNLQSIWPLKSGQLTLPYFHCAHSFKKR